MEETISIIKDVPIDIIYQQDKAQVDVQIATAKQYPRSIKKAIDNSIITACLDVETASVCTYSLPRGGKPITGVSIHLAKILAQNWGNIKTASRVISIDTKHVTSQGVAFDLENNVSVSVEVKRSIVGKYGRFNDDMITVTCRATDAIAMRNAILFVIPKQVIDKVYKQVLNVITGDVSDEVKLMAKRKAVINAFKDSYGVTEQELLKVIGKASIDHIDVDNIVTLIGFGNAIKDGDSTIEDIFRPKSKDVKQTNVMAVVENETINLKTK